jgi:membrane fusion protein, copper/silver efflux system
MTPGWVETGSRKRWVAALIALTLVVVVAVIWLNQRREASVSETQTASYSCPMHPAYRSDKPGNCPICDMKLVPTSPVSGAAATPATPSAASAVHISPERQQQVGLEFAVAENKPARIEIRAVGRVAFDERRIAHVHTKIGGWIEDVFVDFIGQPVRKGQPLFALYSPDLVAGQEEYLLALRARAELGQSSMPRIAQSSEALLVAARRRLELWDMPPAQIAELERTGKVSRTVTIVSPVNGVVTERAAYHHGRTVTPDLDLYTIVDLSRVWVLASIYEYELPHVRVGQTVEATLPDATDAPRLTGKIAFIAPFLDPATRTAEVRAEFDNRDGALKPEMFVNVTLVRDLGPRLIVPKGAVMDSGTKRYVFVDKGGGYLEPREVVAGPEVTSGRVIESGIQEGERVVTAANFIVDSESQLKGAFEAMGTSSSVTSPMPGVTARLTTDPSPARVGTNRIRAEVADESGEPIEGAEVEVRLRMPGMGAMPPMETKADLKDAGKGVYTGGLEIPMAWSWSATVTVRKTDRLLGTVETTIMAR